MREVKNISLKKKSFSRNNNIDGFLKKNHTNYSLSYWRSRNGHLSKSTTIFFNSLNTDK